MAQLQAAHFVSKALREMLATSGGWNEKLAKGLPEIGFLLRDAAAARQLDPSELDDATRIVGYGHSGAMDLDSATAEAEVLRLLSLYYDLLTR